MSAGAIRLDPGVRRPRPDLLVGGWPRRVLRLGPAGVRALDALLAGERTPSCTSLLSRLAGAGMVLTEPQDGLPEDVTVVVPVRGQASDAQTVLDGVPRGVRVVVVDDGSDPPLALPGAQVVRRPVSGGPAAARNQGAALADTRLVAFVDGDVALPDGWLSRLAGHFADERVVAAAPRIRSTPGPGLVGVLEERLGALDLGASPGEVGVGRRVSYVPSAVLVVRRDAFIAVGGFDESLLVGEDVDLVWRLTGRGVVRYDAEVEVRHGARRSLRAALRRRRDYGGSAALLDVRHPGQVRHLVLSFWTALPWLAAAVHPGFAAAAVAVLVARAPGALPALPPDVARRLVVEGQLTAVGAAGRYALRPGLPLVVASGLMSRRVRRLLPILAAAYGWSVRGDLAGGVSVAGLRVLDDLSYSVGVWEGCLRARRWRPLAPAVRRRS